MAICLDCLDRLTWQLQTAKQKFSELVDRALSEGPQVVTRRGREQTLEEVAEHAARRLPVLVELPVQSSWWGYYEVSPDWNAMVGEAAEPTGFFYATGFSGHGFQQAPAVGEHVAELIAGHEPTLDLAAFDVMRFERGLVRPETFVI